MTTFTVKEIAMLGALLDQEIEKQRRLTFSDDMQVQWTAHEELFNLKDLQKKVTTLFHETE